MRRKLLVLSVTLVCLIAIMGVGVSLAQPETQDLSTEITSWHATWYSLTGDLQWGGDVGYSDLPATFDLDWGQGIVYGTFADYIGFKASNRVYAPYTGLVYFNIAADDTVKLFIDGIAVLDDPYLGYDQTSTHVYLTKGYHDLELWFREKTGDASVTFDCDPQVLLDVDMIRSSLGYLDSRITQLEQWKAQVQGQVSKGDVNMDGIVDVYDLAVIGSHFNTVTN